MFRSAGHSCCLQRCSIKHASRSAATLEIASLLGSHNPTLGQAWRSPETENASGSRLLGRLSSFERARLILVGRVKQIRHGEGYLRFALIGSFGNHFLFENAMGFVRVACDPCKNQCKMGNPL